MGVGRGTMSRARKEKTACLGQKRPDAPEVEHGEERVEAC